VTRGVTIVTGGSGAIGSAIARAFADNGANVAIVARNAERVEHTAQQIGHDTVGIAADVLDERSLVEVRDALLARFDQIEVLVNCAGGNVAAATLPDDAAPFSLSLEGYRQVMELNFGGTVLATRVFGEAMQPGGSIVNVSSMAAGHALTRVGGYGAAKAAVESITRWWAVELARRGTGIRVNAIAPGFVLGDQNRALLVREDGALTERGAKIVARTPLGRLGEPDDLVSTVVWLTSDGARFVTGAVVPIDGGFSAFSGV
jgi:NAD(P)-dependent dehydrogenase (short-subunit alcohol dehydrogenase family)